MAEKLKIQAFYSTILTYTLSLIKDVEIKCLLRNALTDEIDSREVYMKGIDHSYYYEGYVSFKAEELQAAPDHRNNDYKIQ